MNADAHLPAFHLQLGRWQNDPSGIFHDPATGLFHLFLDFENKFNFSNLNTTWAHVVSRDAIRWQRLPVALQPDHAYDCDGIFTGSATIVDGAPVLAYSVRCNKAINMARPANRSDPLLHEWQKFKSNPVVSHEPGYNFRDPTSAWRPPGGGEWRMGVGCSGRVCVYRSADFVSWRDVGSVSHVPGEHMWECPDSFALNGSGEGGSDEGGTNEQGTPWVVKASLGAWDVYSVGRYIFSAAANDTFRPAAGSAPLGWLGAYAAGQVIDWGNYYASKSVWDPLGKRRLLFGWIQEEPTVVRSGQLWQGLLSLPRKLASTRAMAAASCLRRQLRWSRCALVTAPSVAI